MAEYNYSWEQAIEILNKSPKHKKLIYDAYLTSDLIANCQRFYSSDEFKEALDIIKKYSGSNAKILDMPAGNGIASYAFAKSGFRVSALEPDASNRVGRGAIQFVKEHEKNFNLDIYEGWGENLPFENESFNVVYVRQGLHHASDLKKMLKEIFRVLKKGGIVIAVREHVVDDYKNSLKIFLDAQIDHQLYGGENAFTLKDYVNAFVFAGFLIKKTWGPYDNIINLYPQSEAGLKLEMRKSKIYFLLKFTFD